MFYLSFLSSLWESLIHLIGVNLHFAFHNHWFSSLTFYDNFHMNNIKNRELLATFFISPFTFLWFLQFYDCCKRNLNVWSRAWSLNTSLNSFVAFYFDLIMFYFIFLLISFFIIYHYFKRHIQSPSLPRK